MRLAHGALRYVCVSNTQAAGGPCILQALGHPVQFEQGRFGVHLGPARDASLSGRASEARPCDEIGCAIAGNRRVSQTGRSSA